MTMKVPKNKVLMCLWERKVVDIGIFIPYTITQVIVEVVKVVGIGLKRTTNLPQVITEVMDVGKV